MRDHSKDIARVLQTIGIYSSILDTGPQQHVQLIKVSWIKEVSILIKGNVLISGISLSVSLQCKLLVLVLIVLAVIYVVVDVLFLIISLS